MPIVGNFTDVTYDGGTAVTATNGLPVNIISGAPSGGNTITQAVNSSFTGSYTVPNGSYALLSASVFTGTVQLSLNGYLLISGTGGSFVESGGGGSKSAVGGMWIAGGSQVQVLGGSTTVRIVVVS